MKKKSNLQRKGTVYFAFVGWSGSGKTTVISQLIRELKKRGFLVASVKHAPEKYYLEPESKDSFKYLEAGASESFLVGKREIMNSRLTGEKFLFFEEYREQLEQFDFVLSEGLVRKNSPLFEIFNSELSLELKYKTSEIEAIIGDKNIFEDMKFFHRENITDIANFMLEKTKWRKK